MAIQHIPIETSLGVLFGRDCIFFDSAEYDEQGKVLTLEGEINGELVSCAQGEEWIPYRLRFLGIVWYQQLDLDADWTWSASFEERKDTAYLRKHIGAARHYFVQTYDHVFDVLCESYVLEFN